MKYVKQFFNTLSYTLFCNVYYMSFDHNKGSSWRVVTTKRWQNPVHTINNVIKILEDSGFNNIQLTRLDKVV